MNDGSDDGDNQSDKYFCGVGGMEAGKGKVELRTNNVAGGTTHQ